MFRVVFCAPLLGVIPTYEFVFLTRRKTSIGDPVKLTLVPNNNEEGRLAYDAEHQVYSGDINVTQSFSTCDSELLIEGTTFDYFDQRSFHALIFLLTIRSRNPIYAPVFSTRSVLTGEVNEWIGESVQPLVNTAVGAAFPPKTLNRFDKGWIQRHLGRCMRFISRKQFQDCMQALNSFSSIPYVNFSLLVACTGIEAVFKLSGFQKKSRLAEEVEALTDGAVVSDEVFRLYDLRNRVAHGEHRHSQVTAEDSFAAFEVLCVCLERVLERGSFPEPTTDSR